MKNIGTRALALIIAEGFRYSGLHNASDRIFYLVDLIDRKEIDPDTLSPREAHDALYRLRALLTPDAAAQHDNPVAGVRKAVS